MCPISSRHATPLGATQPYSARWPRIALMAWVRWRTSRSRVRNTRPLACCRRALHRHKPHRRPLRRLADRLSVGLVVLLPLHERLDVGGRDQPHLMAELGDLAAPVMRASARLHRDKAGRLSGEEGQHLPATSFLRNITFPAASVPCAWKTRLAISKPIVLTSSTDASLYVVFDTTLWHIDAVGGRPPHQIIYSSELMRLRNFWAK